MTNHYDTLDGWPGFVPEWFEPPPWPTAKAEEMDRGIEQAHVMMRGYEPRHPVTTYVPLKEEVMTTHAHDTETPILSPEGLDAVRVEVGALAKRRLERFAEPGIPHFRYDDNHWHRTTFLGPVEVRITAIMNSVDFETCDDDDGAPDATSRRYTRLGCGADLEFQIPSGVRLWLRKAPFPREAECVVETRDGRFPARHTEPERTHTEPRYQVTREWYRVPIEGPCRFTIEMHEGALEFQWLRVHDFDRSRYGHKLSSGDSAHRMYSGDLIPPWLLWVRSIAPHGYNEIAEFTLTSKPSSPWASALCPPCDKAVEAPCVTKGKLDIEWLCGCGKHTIPRGADPYSEHRKFLGRVAKAGRPAEDYYFSPTELARGIGISAPPRLGEVLVQTQHWDSEGC